MESLVSANAPERAELAEISTATLDGVDCFMLSHETSVGKNPIEATNFLAKAIAEAEGIFDYQQAYVNVKDEVKGKGIRVQNIDILSATGCTLAFEERENVDMFVCLTDTGKIARYLSKHFPK